MLRSKNNIDGKAATWIKENLQYLDPAQVNVLVKYLATFPRKNAPKLDDDAAAAKLHALVGSIPPNDLKQSAKAARQIIDRQVVQWIHNNKDALDTPAAVAALDAYLGAAHPRVPGANLVGCDGFDTLQELVGNTPPIHLRNSIAEAGKIIDDRVVTWIDHHWEAIDPANINRAANNILHTYLSAAPGVNPPRPNQSGLAVGSLTQGDIDALYALVGTTPPANLGKSIAEAGEIANRKVAQWIEKYKATLTKAQVDLLVRYLAADPGNGAAGQKSHNTFDNLIRAVGAGGAVGGVELDALVSLIPPNQLAKSHQLAQKITDDKTVKWIKDNKQTLTPEKVHTLITYLKDVPANGNRANANTLTNGDKLHALVDNTAVNLLTDSIKEAQNIIDEKVVIWISKNGLTKADVTKLITYLKDGGRAGAPDFSEANGAALHALVGGVLAANIPAASLTQSIAAAEAVGKEEVVDHNNDKPGVGEQGGGEDAEEREREELEQALLLSAQEEAYRQVLEQQQGKHKHKEKEHHNAELSTDDSDVEGSNSKPKSRLSFDMRGVAANEFAKITLNGSSLGQLCVSKIKKNYDIAPNKHAPEKFLSKVAQKVLNEAYTELVKANADVTKADFNDFVSAMQKQLRKHPYDGTKDGEQGRDAGFAAWQKDIQHEGSYTNDKMEKFAMISATIQSCSKGKLNTATDRRYDSDEEKMRSFRVIKMLDNKAFNVDNGHRRGR